MSLRPVRRHSDDGHVTFRKPNALASAAHRTPSVPQIIAPSFTATSLRPAYSGLWSMPDASEFLKKWVRKNVNATTAFICTAGRLVEECLREAQEEGLSDAEVKTAAGGNL